MSPSKPDVPLVSLKQPVALRPEHIAAEPTRLHVKQESWRKRDFTAYRSDGSLLLGCKGKTLSPTGRRVFTDSTGLPLFDMRMSWTSFKSAWYLELPGDKSSKKSDPNVIMTVDPSKSLLNVNFDCSFVNAAPGAEGENVVVEVRGLDYKYLRMDVRVGGQTVAHIKRSEDRWSTKLMAKLDFDVEVAEGMDVALVAVLAILVASVTAVQIGTVAAIAS